MNSTIEDIFKKSFLSTIRSVPLSCCIDYCYKVFNFFFSSTLGPDIVASSIQCGIESCLGRNYILQSVNVTIIFEHPSSIIVRILQVLLNLEYYKLCEILTFPLILGEIDNR